jgi:hypothetical protein
MIIFLIHSKLRKVAGGVKVIRGGGGEKMADSTWKIGGGAGEQRLNQEYGLGQCGIVGKAWGWCILDIRLLRRV